MGRPLRDLTGLTFGHLTVLRREPDMPRPYWFCSCDCGNERAIAASHLVSGNITSCGCTRIAATVARNKARSDGRTAHPFHVTWLGIRQRCLNDTSTSWPDYGGRGITVYAAWADDFWAFANWVTENLGPAPDGCTLDRIDNDGPYAPGNLRWATRVQQRANRRDMVTGARRLEAEVATLAAVLYDLAWRD